MAITEQKKKPPQPLTPAFGVANPGFTNYWTLPADSSTPAVMTYDPKETVMGGMFCKAADGTLVILRDSSQISMGQGLSDLFHTVGAYIRGDSETADLLRYGSYNPGNTFVDPCFRV